MKKLTKLALAALMSVSVMACGTSDQPASSGDALFKAGTYEAEADGFGGSANPVHLSVTLTDSAIESIEYKADGETPTVGGAALPKLVENVLAAQSPNIDGVSGATVTSTAFFTALNDALTQAGADPASIEPKDTGAAPAEDIEKEADIVIAGAGGAGMTAAITAAQAGKKVIILEKGSVSGGNSSYATGGMNAADTHYQAEQGIEDSADLYYADTMKGGHDINNPDLVRTLAENSSARLTGSIPSALRFPTSVRPAALLQCASTVLSMMRERFSPSAHIWLNI